VIGGQIGSVKVGDGYPVRIMAVINLSRESFYKGSVATPDNVLSQATALADEGADLIDLGAVSTAPGSPEIDEATERERLMPALKQILENTNIDISVDTQRNTIAKEALSMGAACINDVSGLKDPEMARVIADQDGSTVIMASRDRPGDMLMLSEIISVLGERVRSAIAAGVTAEKISIDPGVGRWIPEKMPEHDLAILDGMRRLRAVGRPIMAAVSRKSFIGARLNQPDPFQRLSGSLAATAIAVYNGAHIVRTHDVCASLNTIRMAEAIRGLPACARSEDVDAEVLGHMGGQELLEHLRRVGVDDGGEAILCRKGGFRFVSLRGISSMEAIIIKQEMLARGGDAAIPRLALRCDPRPENILIFGTAAQISGLIKKLEKQPFRLPIIAKAIDNALSKIDDPSRYR
jgi:dihydropteroate synthase